MKLLWPLPLDHSRKTEFEWKLVSTKTRGGCPLPCVRAFQGVLLQEDLQRQVTQAYEPGSISMFHFLRCFLVQPTE